MQDTSWEMIVDGRVPCGLGGLFYGVYSGMVTDTQDPDAQGRVKVKLPWSPDSNGCSYETWARLSTMMGGNQRGSWFIPDVNDEVLVMFEAGDPRRPYVIGALWNGQDAPPAQMDAKNNKKVLCSRTGIRITLDDTDGQVTLTLETPGNQKMVFADTPGSITIQDSNNNSITLDASGITLSTQGTVTISADEHEVTASTITANAGFSSFSGLLQSDTHMTNTTISSTYIPGVGNLL